MLTAVFSASSAMAQVRYYQVSGKVLQGDTKAPMQSASVQAQHTTIGTATDTEGNFTIYLPEGGYGWLSVSPDIKRRVAASVHPTVTSKHDRGIETREKSWRPWPLWHPMKWRMDGRKNGSFSKMHSLAKRPIAPIVIYWTFRIEIFFSKKRNRFFKKCSKNHYRSRIRHWDIRSVIHWIHSFTNTSLASASTPGFHVWRTQVGWSGPGKGVERSEKQGLPWLHPAFYAQRISATIDGRRIWNTVSHYSE